MSALDLIFQRMDTAGDLSLNADIYKHSEVTISPQLTFPAYTAGAAAFFGSFFLVFFIGTGFTSIPLSYLVGFADRPKKLGEDEYRRKKEELAHTIDKQLARGRDLYKRRL